MDIENLKKQATAITNLYNSKNYIETIDKGKRLIKKFPNQIIFYNATSLALSAEGQNDEAIKLLNKALRVDPKNIYVLNNLGLIKFNMNLDEDSEIVNSSQIIEDVISALVNLGYSRSEVFSVVMKVKKEFSLKNKNKEFTVSKIVPIALRDLSKGLK